MSQEPSSSPSPGPDVEFYFDYTGGTPAAEAVIEGIRFMTMPTPALAMTQEAADEIALHWSSAAGG